MYGIVFIRPDGQKEMASAKVYTSQAAAQLDLADMVRMFGDNLQSRFRVAQISWIIPC